MIEFTWLPQSTGAWLIACSVFGALGYWMGVVREARKARIEVQAMGSEVEKLLAATKTQVDAAHALAEESSESAARAWRLLGDRDAKLLIAARTVEAREKGGDS